MDGLHELQSYLTADLGSLVVSVLLRQPQLLCPVRTAQLPGSIATRAEIRARCMETQGSA